MSIWQEKVASTPLDGCKYTDFTALFCTTNCTTILSTTMAPSENFNNLCVFFRSDILRCNDVGFKLLGKSSKSHVWLNREYLYSSFSKWTTQSSENFFASWQLPKTWLEQYIRKRKQWKFQKGTSSYYTKRKRKSQPHQNKSSQHIHSPLKCILKKISAHQQITYYRVHHLRCSMYLSKKRHY